ncbi:MAG TPA: arylamine N-acetyltransferase [Chthoniobacterales bacterium]|nr:arylamine N-acetyltransferase [Chthoniobacterales bacterium]
MPDPTFPLDAYAARIGWSGPLPVDPATLVALHRHHAHAVPFENIDPLCGRPISIDPEALVRKIIHQRRGGYCYEQNGLFCLALQTTGFSTISLAARVAISEGQYAARTHQITLVDFGGSRWLADVGFGGNGLIEAIPFELECEFDQGLDRYRLVTEPTYGYRLQHLLPHGWRTLYAFSLDPFLPADYRALNYFISRSPDSTFTQIPICVRTTPTERRLIVADQYKVRTAAGTSVPEKIETPARMRELLVEQLGIPVPDDLVLPTPQPAPAGTRDI